MSAAVSESPDVVLISAGIMSATLGTVLKELEPALNVVMFETLNDCAQKARRRGTTRARATRLTANSTTRRSVPTAASTFPGPFRSTPSSTSRASSGRTSSPRVPSQTRTLSLKAART